MAAVDVFHSLLNDYEDLKKGPLLADASGLAALERTYPKVLLLASASYLEVATVEKVLALFVSSTEPSLVTFVEKAALERKFHTFFDWKSGKATGFFAQFGPQVKSRFNGRLAGDAEFRAAVAAFMEICTLRNLLVHNNYADFSLDKTAEEIGVLHVRACRFPEEIASVVADPARESELQVDE